MVTIKRAIIKEGFPPFVIGKNPFVFISLGEHKSIGCVNLQDGKMYVLDPQDNIFSVTRKMMNRYQGEGSLEVVQHMEVVHHKDQITVSVTDVLRGVKGTYLGMLGADDINALEVIIHTYKK